GNVGRLRIEAGVGVHADGRGGAVRRASGILAGAAGAAVAHDQRPWISAATTAAAGAAAAAATATAAAGAAGAAAAAAAATTATAAVATVAAGPRAVRAAGRQRQH